MTEIEYGILRDLIKMLKHKLLERLTFQMDDSYGGS